MSTFIPTDISGGTLNTGSGLNIKDVLTITESKYVNESGDKCESLQVAKEPKEDKDVVNKKALEKRIEQIKFHLDKEFQSLSVLFKAYLIKLVKDTKNEIEKDYKEEIKKLEKDNESDINKLKTEYKNDIKKIDDFTRETKLNYGQRITIHADEIVKVHSTINSINENIENV